MITPATPKDKKKVPSKAKTKPKSKKPVIPRRHPRNPYRQGSKYGLCFDVLAKMGLSKPVTRKALTEAYSKASGKDEKHARYDLAVILSPTKDGDGHRSSKKFAYWVERLENSAVRLHLCDSEGGSN